MSPTSFFYGKIAPKLLAAGVLHGTRRGANDAPQSPYSLVGWGTVSPSPDTSWPDGRLRCLDFRVSNFSQHMLTIVTYSLYPAFNFSYEWYWMVCLTEQLNQHFSCRQQLWRHIWLFSLRQFWSLAYSYITTGLIISPILSQDQYQGSKYFLS